MAMGKGAWARTPYADTTAKDTERDIIRLFEKYRVSHYQFTNTTGPHGRPAFSIAFMHDKRAYKAGLEILDVANVPDDQLLRQVKRCIFWRLKVGLEMSGIFSAEQVFFDWLLNADGQTTYEVAMPMIKELEPGQLPNFAQVFDQSNQKLLPPAGGRHGRD
jgi:hypothetical protein